MTTPTNAGLRILNPSVIPLFRGDSDTQVIAVESVLVKLERTACAPELARNALALLDWITFAARAQDVDLTSKPVHLDPARARQVLQFSTTQWRESVHVLHRLRVMVPKQKQRYAIQPDVLTYHPSRAQFRPDLIATHATAKVGPVALIGAARALLVLTGVADVDVALPPVVVSTPNLVRWSQLGKSQAFAALKVLTDADLAIAEPERGVYSLTPACFGMMGATFALEPRAGVKRPRRATLPPTARPVPSAATTVTTNAPIVATAEPAIWSAEFAQFVKATATAGWSPEELARYVKALRS
jgi:hypothetical protein